MNVAQQVWNKPGGLFQFGFLLPAPVPTVLPRQSPTLIYSSSSLPFIPFLDSLASSLPSSFLLTELLVKDFYLSPFLPPLVSSSSSLRFTESLWILTDESRIFALMKVLMGDSLVLFKNTGHLLIFDVFGLLVSQHFLMIVEQQVKKQLQTEDTNMLVRFVFRK